MGALGNLAVTNRVDTATINKVLKQVIDPLLQKRIYLSMLLKKGRVKYNQSGKEVEWRVRYLRNSGEDFDDLDGMTIERVNRHKSASLGWGGLQMSEGISMIEQEINKGPEAVIKIASNLIDWMKSDLVIDLETRLITGSTGNSTTKIYGLEDMLAAASTPVEVSNTAGNLAVKPSDTYAGLYTTMGYYGGTAATYPDGDVSEEAVFWSPTLVDWKSDNVETADAAAWADNFEEAIRFGVSAMDTIHSTTPSVILVTPKMLRQARNAQDSRATINIDRGDKSSLAMKLGFTDLSVDNVPIASGVGIPSGVGYGIDFDHVELRCLRKQLFTEKSQEDLTVHSKFFNLCFLGQQAVDSPCYAMKLADYTTT